MAVTIRNAISEYENLDDQGVTENEESAAATKTPAAAVTSATTPTAVTTTTPVNVLAPVPAASPVAPAAPSPVAPAATAATAATAASGGAEEAAATAQLDAARKAELDAIKKRSLETAKLTAAADEEQARSDIAAAEKEKQLKEDAKKFRPPEFKPITYNPPKPPTLIEQLGSSTMLFAMLGGLFTRTHAITALNAATGALNGFKEGNEAKGKQALEQWKTANENMLQAARFQQEVYNNVMKDVNDRVQYEKEINTAKGKERTAKLKAAALALDDNVMLAQIEREQAKGAYDELERRRRMQETHEEHTAKLEAAQEKKETKDALTAKLTDPEFLLLPADEALTKVAEMGTDAVEMFNKQAFQTTFSAARVKAKEKTDEYKAADKITKLAMLADAGSKEARTLLTKHRDREDKGQLSEQEQIDRNTVDERIARGLAPMPASGKAGSESDKAYNATLARVLKINPDYDPTEYGNAEKILAGWRDGAKKDGSEIKAYNTATHHLNLMDELVDALNTRNQQTINSVKKRIAAAIGQPQLENASVDTMSAILADEITKATLGNPGSAGERTAREAKFVSTLPIDVLKTNIATSKAAIGGRLAASQKSFETGTKREKKEFWNLLEDGTKQAHAAVLGIPEDQIPKTPKERAFSQSSSQPGVTPGAAPAPGAAPPAARPTGVPEGASKTGTDKSGKFYFDPSNKSVVYDVETGKPFSFDKDGNRVYK
jgi:hypothetical protein